MPRTKLDKYRISRTDVETIIIKKAMADKGFFTNKSFAQCMGTTNSYLSKGFKNGFSLKMKLRMHKVLKFSEEDWRVLCG